MKSYLVVVDARTAYETEVLADNEDEAMQEAIYKFEEQFLQHDLEIGAEVTFLEDIGDEEDDEEEVG